MRNSLISALGFCILASSPAFAESAPDLSGSWSFKALIQTDCSFGGTAFLQRVDETRYEGELTARQSCAGLEEDFLVRQDCAASVLGNQVSVRCEIVEFVNGFESPYYYPDNFSLTIASSNRLYGALISFGPANPAEWSRQDAGVS